MTVGLAGVGIGPAVAAAHGAEDLRADASQIRMTLLAIAAVGLDNDAHDCGHEEQLHHS